MRSSETRKTQWYGDTSITHSKVKIILSVHNSNTSTVSISTVQGTVSVLVLGFKYQLLYEENISALLRRVNTNTLTFAVNVQIDMANLQDPCTLLYHSNVDRDIASAMWLQMSRIFHTYGSLFQFRVYYVITGAARHS